MSTTDFLSKIYTVKFEKLLSNGCTLAHAEGMAVFVPFGIPGETADIKIIEQKKGYLSGKILGISQWDETDRVIPPCRIFGRCGGCSLQHIKYEKQLDLKKEMLLETLSRTGHLDLKFIPEIKVFPSKPYGYRHRVQLHPEETGKVGFMEASTNQVIPVTECPVCCDALNLKLRENLKLKERTIFYSPDNRNIYSPYYGTKEFEFFLLDKNIFANSQCFFQSNVDLYKEVIKELLLNVNSGNIYVDFYSGIGLPGLFMADRFQELYFVEENPISARFGLKNTRCYDNCRFFNLKTEVWIKSPRGAIKPDTVFVDPPRTGLSEIVKDYLIKKKPNDIFYLSCNFTTLARDLSKLTTGGYRIKMFDIFDFYPQTADMECLVHLKMN